MALPFKGVLTLQPHRLQTRATLLSTDERLLLGGLLREAGVFSVDTARRRLSDRGEASFADRGVRAECFCKLRSHCCEPCSPNRFTRTRCCSHTPSHGARPPARRLGIQLSSIHAVRTPPF
jgi:hypothetical protein